MSLGQRDESPLFENDSSRADHLRAGQSNQVCIIQLALLSKTTSTMLVQSKLVFVQFFLVASLIVSIIQFSKCFQIDGQDELFGGSSLPAFESYRRQRSSKRLDWSSLLVGEDTNKPSASKQTADGKLSPTSNSTLASSLESKASSTSSPKWSASRPNDGKIVRIQVTAIHVDRAEFPLSRLLFKLTLKLALEAVTKQLEEQQQQQRSPGGQFKVKLSVSIRSANTCSRQFASAVAAEEYYTKRARLFIVSGCDDAIRGVARLASLWRVPVMTGAGFGGDLNDKKVYKTLVRVAFSLRAAVEFLFKIMRTFQWRRINLIVDESDANSLALKGSIERYLNDYHRELIKANSSRSNEFVYFNTISFDLQSLARQQQQQQQEASLSNATKQTNESIPSTNDDRWPNELTERTIQHSLRQSSMYSKVNILLIPQQQLRKFMLSVYDENMANGMYTFINMPLLLAANDDQTETSTNSAATNHSSGQRASFASTSTSSASSTGENVFVWRSLRSSRNSQAKQAFESLMSIYLRTPTSKAYVYFVSKLTSLANDQVRSKLQLSVNPYSASFYDCLLIYSIALAESLASLRTLEEQHVLQNNNQVQRWMDSGQVHANISDLIRNRRFENMLTGAVAINANGDRETDYTLDDMNQMTGRYSPVILYRADTRDIERLGRIHWSSDPSVGPTTDSVDCSLSGLCASKPSKLSLESKLVDYWWKIHLSDVEIVMTRRKNANDGSLIMSGGGAGGAGYGAESSLVSSSHGGQLRPAPGSGGGGGGGSLIGCDKTTAITRATDTTAMASSMDVCYGNITLAVYKLAKVALKPISKFHQSRKLMIELRTIKDINHSNLCRFVGIIVDEASTAIVSEFCPKGSLREFFHNESMVIDWTFKYSIINDIIAGLLYLHSSQLGFHGRLKSSNCLVSARFVVKLSDYGPHSLYEQIDSDEEESSSYYMKRIWLAPEHMKRSTCSSSPSSSSSSSKVGSMKGDIYSFGLLLYEIITNKLPFYVAEKEDFVMPLKSLYQELKLNGPTRETGPDLSAIELATSSQQVADLNDNQLAQQEDVNLQPLVELMQSCWRFEPAKRPSSMVLGTAIKRITRGVTSKKLLENLTSRMEQYTNNLESLVDAKLATLLEEKLKTEELLYQFVPKSIASILKEGQTVEPEAFDCVTVFYSDIVGFTSLSSESSPMEVVDFLSDLYVCFDETLEQHDIFKVDTIGDAYIVASGLPKRNEGKHVIEIASAALELRDRLKQFKIPHKPKRALEMRVGIHSGPCIAGIVGGLNMPKYCVFGDTLTIGKFMESQGLPMKIHITEESRRLLEGVGGFVMEPRAPRITKDGLPFQTYWLEKAA